MNQNIETNKRIYKETQTLCWENLALREACFKSRDGQRYLAQEEEVVLPPNPGRAGAAVVSKKRTLEAAKEYVEQGKKVCVLMSADGRTPGGRCCIWRRFTGSKLMPVYDVAR